VNIVLIRKNHNLSLFALALKNSEILIFEYNKISDLVKLVRGAPPKSNIIFYNPSWLLIIIGFFKLNSNFYYFLHEPYLSFKRVKKITLFIGYKIWLNFIAFRFRFICLSEYGKNVAKNNIFIGHRVVKDIVPLGIELSPLEDNNKIYDFCMWGSLSDDKGLDRVLHFSALYPQYRICILTRSNSAIISFAAKYQNICPNLIFKLSKNYIPDSEIFAMVSSTKVVLLPQRYATQSAQLPIALGLGVPVISSDVGSFNEFLNHQSNSKCGEIISNEISDDAFSKEIDAAFRKILTNYQLYVVSALSIYRLLFSPKSVQKFLQNILKV
jgi:glycosyltransferase involved in cell wall biosynthesis